MKRTPLGYAAFVFFLILAGCALWFADGRRHPQLFGVTELVSIVFMIWLMNKVEPRRFDLMGRKMGLSVRGEILEIPCSHLTISSHDKAHASDLDLPAPVQLTMSIHVLTGNLGHTVKAIQLEGHSDGLVIKHDSLRICVEGGTLLMGDKSFIQKLRQTRQIEQGTSKLFDSEAANPYCLFRHEGAVQAIALITGEGDDWYDIKMDVSEGGGLIVSVQFLDDEESNSYCGSYRQ